MSKMFYGILIGPEAAYKTLILLQVVWRKKKMEESSGLMASMNMKSKNTDIPKKHNYKTHVCIYMIFFS